MKHILRIVIALVIFMSSLHTSAVAMGGPPTLKLIWPSLTGSNIVFGTTISAIGTQDEIQIAIAKSREFLSKQTPRASGRLIVPPAYLPIQRPNGQIEVYLASIVFARFVCADLSVQTDATLWSLELISGLSGILDGFATPDLGEENRAAQKKD